MKDQMKRIEQLANNLEPEMKESEEDWEDVDSEEEEKTIVMEDRTMSMSEFIGLLEATVRFQ